MRSFPEFPVEAASAFQLPLAVFDEIECGLIVCDAQGVIAVANQAAQHELASQRLAVQRGRLSLVRLARPGDQLLVSVLPLAGRSGERPRALVVLGRRQPCSDLGLEMLAGSYGLTLAERRVLAALVREATPREIARQHAVALSTVRTQISSIRAKFGTRSIEGLLLRAAQVPPVASALRLAAVSPAARPAAPLLAAA